MAGPGNEDEHPVYEWGLVAPQHAEAEEQDPDWRMRPLMKAIGEGLAYQFFWKAETDTVQTYEHRLSYRYVHLDKQTGQFYNQRRRPISVEAALIHALAYPQLPQPEMKLAPVVLEPDLQPFVRMFARNDGTRRLPAPANAQPARMNALVSAVSLPIRNTYRALTSFARSTSAPRCEGPEQRALGNFDQRELQVSAFMRRTV